MKSVPNALRHFLETLDENEREHALGRLSLFNPPGRSSIHYRIGTYESFARRMLDQVNLEEIPDGRWAGHLPLRLLDVSEERNWVVALIEAWAVVGDVLSFYQERIANEGYLRTAVEALSVRELVRLLNYRPAPGFAGSAALAFTVGRAKDMPEQTTVEEGSRILSLPVANALPETFETSSALEAHVDLNALHPLLPTVPHGQILPSTASEARLAGTQIGLSAGAALLIIDRATEQEAHTATSKPGASKAEQTDKKIAAAPSRFFRIATKVDAEFGTATAEARTRVEWDGQLDDSDAQRPISPEIYLLQQKSHLFGYNAVAWENLALDVQRQYQPLLVGVQVSADQGLNWQPINSGLPIQKVRALAAGDQDSLFISLADVGVYRSLNRGRSWQAARFGLPQLNINVLYVDDAGHLFAGTASGIYRSIDLATTWDPITAQASAATSQRKSSKHLYPTLPQTTVRALLTARSKRGTELFAGTDNGVFRCRLPGSSWKAVNRGLPDYQKDSGMAQIEVLSLANGPNEGELYVGTTSGVFFSSDRGGKWQTRNRGLPQVDPETGFSTTAVPSLICHHDRRTGKTSLLAATAQGVFGATDTGGWRLMSRGLSDPDVASLAIAVDSSTMQSVVFAATASGLFASDDLGETWRQKDLDHDEQNVEALTVTPDGEIIVAIPPAGFAIDEWPGFHLRSPFIDLSGLVPGLPPGSWVVLHQTLDEGSRVGVYQIQRVETARRSDFGVSSTITRLQVASDAPGTGTALESFDLRDTVAHLLSLPLALYVEHLPVLLPPDHNGWPQSRIAFGQVLPRSLLNARPVIVKGRPYRLSLDPASVPFFSADGYRETDLPSGEISVEVLEQQLNPDGTLTLEIRFADGSYHSTRISGENLDWLPAADDGTEISESATAHLLKRPGDESQLIRSAFLSTETLKSADASAEIQVKILHDDGSTETRLVHTSDLSLRTASNATATSSGPPSLPAFGANLLQSDSELQSLAQQNQKIDHQKIVLMQLDPALRTPFDPRTLTVYANVARATLGESVEEIVGSGDSTRSHQRFALKKPPLTYVRDPETGEQDSTLRVYVDEVRWREVPSLYYSRPKAKVYTVRHDRDGNPQIIFGDAIHGSRLPTGIENVRATYRSGLSTTTIGSGQITLLQTRPFGLRGVTNPGPSNPGGMPESPSTSRIAAPLGIRTLDRIVSLLDYQDFALTFPGIAKAQAQVLWRGSQRLVHLTVAAEGGRRLPQDDPLYDRLVRAIRTAGSLSREVRIDSYLPVSFRLEARVTIAEKHLSKNVLQAVRQRLEESYSFAHSFFGQMIDGSQVINVIQQVEGVEAVDLDLLARQLADRPEPDEDNPTEMTLQARSARWNPRLRRIEPADLLIINARTGIVLNGEVA